MTETMDAYTYFKTIEAEHKARVPKYGYLVLRLDGKGFSKLTKNLKQPFDEGFSAAMLSTTHFLCEGEAPILFAYTQSDEISLVIDQTNPASETWFAGQIQKLVSVTAAMASVHFTSELKLPGVFDSRIAGVFPDAEALGGYLAWRRNDAVKNSISMLSSFHYSTEELISLPTKKRLEKLEADGVMWRDVVYPAARSGVFVFPKQVEEEVTFTHKRTGEVGTALATRTHWVEAYGEDFALDDWTRLISS